MTKYYQLEALVALFSEALKTISGTKPEDRDIKEIDPWYGVIAQACLSEYSDRNVDVSDPCLVKLGKLRSLLSKCRNEMLNAHR